jgi:5'-3' exonuclease
MKAGTSPVIDFYPTDFRVDMEGKRADWEGVVLVPFIEEERLLAADASVPLEALTVDERARNKLGNLLVFSPRSGEALGAKRQHGAACKASAESKSALSNEQQATCSLVRAAPGKGGGV